MQLQQQWAFNNPCKHRICTASTEHSIILQWPFEGQMRYIQEVTNSSPTQTNHLPLQHKTRTKVKWSSHWSVEDWRRPEEACSTVLEAGLILPEGSFYRLEAQKCDECQDEFECRLFFPSTLFVAILNNIRFPSSTCYRCRTTILNKLPSFQFTDISYTGLTNCVKICSCCFSPPPNIK